MGDVLKGVSAGKMFSVTVLSTKAADVFTNYLLREEGGSWERQTDPGATLGTARKSSHVKLKRYKIEVFGIDIRGEKPIHLNNTSMRSLQQNKF